MEWRRIRSIGEMRTQKEEKRFGVKAIPLPLCATQIPHTLHWDWSQESVVRSWWQAFWTMAQTQGFNRMYVLVCSNGGCWDCNEKCNCQMLTVELQQNWQTAVTRCYTCSDWWRCWVEEPRNMSRIHYPINPPIALGIWSPTTSQDGGAIQFTVILNAFKDIYMVTEATVCEELEVLTVHRV